MRSLGANFCWLKALTRSTSDVCSPLASMPGRHLGSAADALQLGLALPTADRLLLVRLAQLARPWLGSLVLGLCLFKPLDGLTPARLQLGVFS